jgi:hypothetical protein
MLIHASIFNGHSSEMCMFIFFLFCNRQMQEVSLFVTESEKWAIKKEKLGV